MTAEELLAEVERRAVTVADLLAEVERIGGYLLLEGELLSLMAPMEPAPLPGELMDRLRQHRPELLHLLADPATPWPCPACGCGSFWRDQAGAWWCEECTPPGKVTALRNHPRDEVAKVFADTRKLLERAGRVR
jgi:ribosomal protein L37AE/L43A